MSEEAPQQAQAEGLTLVVAENSTGFFSVCLISNPNPYPNPYPYPNPNPNPNQACT